ncbi:MAG: TRIC cation channel family protein [Deltaproteobacteria bacterium]|nr:MAG: TRIC cation channel family protein [Deltaproteobacteria bacterium]
MCSVGATVRGVGRVSCRTIPIDSFFAVDLAGTFVFAVEGATTALGSSLDVFGVMMLSSPTALSRGIMRALLIGAVPSLSIRGLALCRRGV